MSSYRNKIYEWEGDDTQPYPNNFTFKSGRILLPFRKTFGCARVIADTGDRQDYYDSIIEQQQIIARNNTRISAGLIGGGIGEDEVGADIEINGDRLEEVPTVADYSGDFNLNLKIYGDDVLLFTKDIYTNNRPFRLPLGGIRARAWEVEITGNVKVRRFDMADSVDELKVIQVSA